MTQRALYGSDNVVVVIHIDPVTMWHPGCINWSLSVPQPWIYGQVGHQQKYKMYVCTMHDFRLWHWTSATGQVTLDVVGMPHKSCWQSSAGNDSRWNLSSLHQPISQCQHYLSAVLCTLYCTVYVLVKSCILHTYSDIRWVVFLVL